MHLNKAFKSVREALETPLDAIRIDIQNRGSEEGEHPMPAGLEKLVNLEEFNVDCSLTTFTEVPDAIGSLKKLKALSLAQTNVTRISPRIRELQALERLWVGSKMEELPEEITELTSLKTLSIVGGQLTRLPENIGRLRNLTVLWIPHAQITHLPESLGDLQALTEISLSRCGLLDLEQAFSVLSRLPNLRQIELSYGAFTALPAQIGGCRALEFLDIANNRYLHYLPEEMKQLGNWKTIRLHSGNTVLKKALKKLLPDGKLISKWAVEGEVGYKQEYSDTQRYTRKNVEIIWDGRRVTSMP